MNESVSRREMLASLVKASAVACGLVALLPTVAQGDDALGITVYKDSSCGCCTRWVEHLRAAGFRPVVHDRSDMDAMKDTLGVPASLRSCHTAVAGKYVVEGHVPAADIKRLLSATPPGVIGVAVPDMPAGSPGMEMSGRRDSYDVIAYAATGKTSLFARH